jgi:TatD DNase family protein
MYIDTHCHLDMFSDSEIEEIVERAKISGVLKILSNGVNPETNKKVLELSGKYEEVEACLGLYPIDALSLSDEEIDKEIEFIRENKNKFFGIGEIGLDFKEDLKEWERQKEVFRKFIRLSLDLKKPMFIHSRKAEKECIEILEEEKAERVIMHCFSGNFKLVSRILENNWFLTIPTCVKHAEHFQKVIEKAGMGRLLCETDSPFLHPDRNGNNEPGNVLTSYRKIAELKSLDLKKVEKIIERNYNSL